MTYDSTADTQKHIDRVGDLILETMDNLHLRAARHDQSKLTGEEKEAFDIATPKLRDLVYGSPEYREALREIRPALKHHYANNSHHPEYYENGIDGMSLLDLVEMLCDWKAAGERSADGGDILRSIEINQERHGLSDQLASILRNTAHELGFVES